MPGRPARPHAGLELVTDVAHRRRRLVERPSVAEGWIGWNGRRTWYRVVGDVDADGDPLLCLHGGPGSTHHCFAPVERLADEGRAVVVYDQLGCGRSDRPAGVEWRIEVFLEELDAVRAELGLNRVHLLGTSWGGMLALEHALALSDGVTSLILSSTLASAMEWAAEARRLRDELPPKVVSGLDRHERAGTVRSPEYEQALSAFYARHLYRGDGSRPELQRIRSERGLDVYHAMWGPTEWTVTGALRDWDVRARLHELDVPTLVLRGRHDLCTPAIAATLVGGIHGAREVVFEHSSHMPVLEEPDRYLAVVGDFLRQVEDER